MNEDDKKKNQQRLLLDVKASPEARQLTLPKLSFEAERAIQVIAARAVYECNLPFTIFEKNRFLSYIIALILPTDLLRPLNSRTHYLTKSTALLKRR